MATSDQVDTAAGVNALGPKKVQKGDDIIEQHSLADQLALLKYQREQEDAAASTSVAGFGLRMSVLRSINGCG